MDSFAKKIGFVSLALLASCGAQDEDDPNALKFTKDIAPILYESCRGAPSGDCHGSGETGTLYIDNLANVKANAAEMVKRLNLAEAEVGHMPKAGSGKKITDEKKEKLLKYLAQKDLK